MSLVERPHRSSVQRTWLMVFLPSTIPSRMALTNLAPALQPGGDPSPVSILIGVDTHLDFHVAVALSLQGSLLGEMDLLACTDGYEALLDWTLELAEGRATSLLFGIECTGCYGAGLSRHLQAAQFSVREVNRPNRQTPGQPGLIQSSDSSRFRLLSRHRQQCRDVMHHRLQALAD